MARHVEHGVRFGMGTDVGAGTGLSMLKEGLVAYHVQMVRDQGHMLGPAHLLYLATAAGADALGLGDLYRRPARPARRPTSCCCARPPGSTLEAVLEEAPSWDAALGAIFTLAREESRRSRSASRGDVVFAASALDQHEVVAVDASSVARGSTSRTSADFIPITRRSSAAE